MNMIKTPGLMSLHEALSGKVIPSEIKDSLTIIDIPFHDFIGTTWTGQLVVDRSLADEVTEIFADLYRIKFPIARMVPVVVYDWSDDGSMAANNSSAFNYRLKPGKDELSEHARGRAIDLNPMQNPFIGRGLHCPPDAVYDPRVLGTVTEEVAAPFKSRGWTWGADWVTVKDYGHFEKPR